MPEKIDLLKERISELFEQQRKFVYFVVIFCLLTGIASFTYFRFQKSPLPPDQQLETQQAAQTPSVKGATKELPLWFPKDIPIIQPGTNLLSISETKESQQVSLETSKGFAETIGFYLESMRKWGWEQQGLKASDKNQVLAFTKDIRAVEISLSYDPQAKKTVIVISITPSSP